MTHTEFINSLSNIMDTFLSIRAYFYQNIPQTTYTNSGLATYQVNYDLLLPGSNLIKNLTIGEVGAQMQAYIDLCNVLINLIQISPQYQSNLFYENIINQINATIAQLNGFSNALLNAKYSKLIKYKVPYDMGLTEALFNNKIPQALYALEAQLNYTLNDFNNIKQNTEITLTL